MPLSRLYLQKVTLSATATGVRAKTKSTSWQKKDNRIIVVEVKSRSHPIYDISQVITRDKIRHLINAGNAYVKLFNLPHELQFDVILMVGQDPDNFTVEHIPDAFMAPLRTY